MAISEDDYEVFSNRMKEKYPRYFGEGKHFGGFAVGPGWYPILEALIGQIDSYTKWRRRMRAYDLRVARAKKKGREAVLHFISRGKERLIWEEERADDIMEVEQHITERVNWITIEQIKEKFGGLRFYYSGGDDTIGGMVTMAEVWASHSCETCGNKGEKRNGGWIRTLCDQHEEERKAK
jgi:hypothetical protein